MLVLVSHMVPIHISNWVDPITFFTIKGALYIPWQFVHSSTTYHFFKPFYENSQCVF